jgi:hypothetical protein
MVGMDNMRFNVFETLEKVVGIKPFQLVNLMVTVMTALITGALVLWKVGAAVPLSSGWCA